MVPNGVIVMQHAENAWSSVLIASFSLVLVGACATPEPTEPPAPIDETPVEAQASPGVLYVALFRPSASFPTDGAPMEHPTFPAHAEYMEMLHREGFVTRGGPFADFSGALLVFTLDDTEEIDRLLQEEPFVLVDVWTYTIHPWVQALGGSE